MVAAIVSALLGVLIFGFFLAGSDGGIFTFGHQIDALTAFLSTMAVTLGILDLVTGTSAAIIHYKMNSGQYQEVKNNQQLKGLSDKFAIILRNRTEYHLILSQRG